MLVTERQRFNIEESKKAILARDGYMCQYPSCRKGAVYLAHRIANTLANIQKYGDAIVNNPINLVSVCIIPAHNDYFNIGNDPGKCSELLEELMKIIEHVYMQSKRKIPGYLEFQTSIGNSVIDGIAIKRYIYRVPVDMVVLFEAMGAIKVDYDALVENQ